MSLVHTDMNIIRFKALSQTLEHIFYQSIRSFFVYEKYIVYVVDFFIRLPQEYPIQMRKRLNTRYDFYTCFFAIFYDFDKLFRRIASAKIAEIRFVFRFVRIFRIQHKRIVAHFIHFVRKPFYAAYCGNGVSRTINHYSESFNFHCLFNNLLSN